MVEFLSPTMKLSTSIGLTEAKNALFTFKFAWILHVPKFGSSESGKLRHANSVDMHSKYLHPCMNRKVQYC